MHASARLAFYVWDYVSCGSWPVVLVREGITMLVKYSLDKMYSLHSCSGYTSEYLLFILMGISTAGIRENITLIIRTLHYPKLRSCMEAQGHNFIQSMTTWPVYTCAVITMLISSVIEYRIVVIDTHLNFSCYLIVILTKFLQNLIIQLLTTFALKE